MAKLHVSSPRDSKIGCPQTGQKQESPDRVMVAESNSGRWHFLDDVMRKHAVLLPEMPSIVGFFHLRSTYKH